MKFVINTDNMVVEKPDEAHHTIFDGEGKIAGYVLLTPEELAWPHHVHVDLAGITHHTPVTEDEFAETQARTARHEAEIRAREQRRVDLLRSIGSSEDSAVQALAEVLGVKPV